MPRQSLIDNRGPNHLLAALKRILDHAKEADFSVAFVSAIGVSRILPSLYKVAGRGTVRVLTGFYQGITEPAALTQLLRAQGRTQGRLSVRISSDPKFHRKVYFSSAVSSAVVIIGSSNLTGDGIGSSGELNVSLSGSPREGAILRARRIFDEDWNHRSYALRTEHIEKYAHARGQIVLRAPKISLSRIFGKFLKHERLKPPDPTYWRAYLDGELRSQTSAVVEDATNWDREGYIYFTSPRADKYSKNDRILLFDFNDKTAELVQVKETTELSTSEGRYFVAHKRLRGTSRRRMTPRFWASIRHGGTNISKQKKARQMRRLTRAQWDEVSKEFIR